MPQSESADRRRGPEAAEAGGTCDRPYADAALAMLSGALVACSFPPADRHWLVWIALVPLLWVVVRSTGAVRALILGCAGGLVCGAILLDPLVSAHLWTGWGLLPLDQLDAARTRQYWVLRFLWVLLSVWFALFWGVFAGALRWLVGYRRPLTVATAPCLWVLGPEWLRSQASWGFQWGFLGNATADLPRIRQLAAFGGVWLLSALVVTVNAAVVACLGRRGWRSFRVAPLTAAVLVAAAWLGGEWRMRELASISPSVGAVAIQHHKERYGREDYLSIGLDRSYLRAVDVALGKLEGRVRLLVLPESVGLGAVNLDGSASRARPPGAQAELAGWERALGRVLGDREVVLVLGVDTIEGGRAFNSLVAWTSGGVAGWYHKRRLVPFAEYQPRLWAWGLRGESQYSAGDGTRIMNVGGLDLGGFICQEVLSPSLVRRSVRDGATVLVSGGNDGVFTSPAVARIHADLAQLRAVESGRYLVRAMKTGITAVIDPAGTELARIEPSEPTVLLASIEPLDHRTPYVRFGDWVLYVALAGVIACVLLRPRLRGRGVKSG